ncbi:hypothetical protein [Rhodohalobacter mucosus]|uniref:Uncharacterized protein n=1 Tax=Rhodohalobacter mucosus TaxID=2079485 RepID=A0A316TMS0_9BACT|nr:hypothetical protein [Rhodohalobacter mucosus]PWN05720.1 hypothetical protein DDZ15_14135 [Rhodohalobacter mucosus]
MFMLRKYILLIIFCLFAVPSLYAQFDDPVFEKVERSERAKFEQMFADISWTGQGLYNSTTIDRIPTVELRSRLQAVFGEPTQTIGDLINNRNFRPGKAVQFEYWFIIDDRIPLMLLDLDGPFENGLVYVGASRYIDMMPQVKRTLNRMLMNEYGELASFSDYFYSPERDQWYLVEYRDGEFNHEAIERPASLR